MFVNMPKFVRCYVCERGWHLASVNMCVDCARKKAKKVN